VNFSSATIGDLETLAHAAQIPHSSTSCREGTAKSFIKKFEEKSLPFFYKSKILDGETLTRATPTDLERELPYPTLILI